MSNERSSVSSQLSQFIVGGSQFLKPEQNLFPTIDPAWLREHGYEYYERSLSTIHYLSQMGTMVASWKRFWWNSAHMLMGKAWHEAVDSFLCHQQATNCAIELHSRPYYMQEPEWKISYEIIKSEVFADLIRFKPYDSSKPNALIVPPISGHYPTLVEGTVRSLLLEFNTFVINWKNIRDIPISEGDFTFEMNTEIVKRYIQMIGQYTNIVAVCQGGVHAFRAAALLSQHRDPCQPHSLTLLGTPIDTREPSNQITEFANSRSLKWMEENLHWRVPSYYRGAGRSVYPGHLQIAAFYLKSRKMHEDRFNNYIKALAESNLGKHHQEVVKWYQETVEAFNLPLDMGARWHTESVRSQFQDHDLALGNATQYGEKIDPTAIRSTYLMCCGGEEDDITHPEHCHAASYLCTNLFDSYKKKMVVEDAGHYKIFSGKTFKYNVLPNIVKMSRRPPLF